MHPHDTLSFVRDAGETRRYHGRAVLRHQSVAEHSFHVAMILDWLGRLTGDIPSKTLLMAALCHDLAEHVMGDLPAPSKRRLPAYGEESFRTVWGNLEAELLRPHKLAWEEKLSKEEAFTLKLADAVEGCLYCIRERAMGNRLIVEVYDTFRHYVTELLEEWNKPWTGAKIEQYIDKQWSDANG